jgi:hypothetical protein
MIFIPYLLKAKIRSRTVISLSYPSRRAILQTAIGLQLLPSGRAWAIGLDIKLSELADVIEAATKAVEKIPDIVKAATVGIDQGVRAIIARRVRNKLIDLDARLKINNNVSNKSVLGQLDAYIAQWNKHKTAEATVSAGQLANQWSAVLALVKDTLTEAKGLLADLRENRSDLVLNDAYDSLLGALAAKIGVFDQLLTSPAPSTEAEISALTSLRSNSMT